MFEDEFEKPSVPHTDWHPDDDLHRFDEVELRNETSQDHSAAAPEELNDPEAIFEAYCRSGHERGGPSPFDRQREHKQKNANP